MHPLENIFRTTLDRCAPDWLVSSKLEPRDGDRGFAIPTSRFDVKLAGPGHLWMFGAGKAALRMAQGVLEKLGPQIRGGVIIMPDGATPPPSKLGPVEVMVGSHPHPTEKSLASTRRLLEIAAMCTANDHALFLLSGGASALLVSPNDGITLAEKAEVARALMDSGAPISELNTVRKHLSQVKGGRLISKFRCGVTVLVLSDVAGNSVATIGSGPFVADLTTRADARRILESRLSQPSIRVLAALTETPQATASPRHVLLADGHEMARVAAQVAREQTTVNVILNETPIESGALGLAADYAATVADRRQPQLLVRFGEPILRITRAQAGRGGRSQHLALALADHLRGIPGWSFLAAGTDGIDGNNDAAGGLVDGGTCQRAEQAGVNVAQALARFDSYSALLAAGALVRTGLTGNNLQDLHLLRCD
ncbi:MAG: DUF4147 domain-containing protein [Deltaproteobacteria bacterium]|nr:DUF4147 domain-containing protein [Deltaproteobacteria bacterium]